MSAQDKENLNALVSKIKGVYKTKTDEEIAGSLKMSVQNVIALRKIAGLFRIVGGGQISAFMGKRKLRYNEDKDQFLISMTIPEKEAKTIGIGSSGEYEYHAYAGKGEIRIEITPKVE